MGFKPSLIIPGWDLGRFAIYMHFILLSASLFVCTRSEGVPLEQKRHNPLGFWLFDYRARVLETLLAHFQGIQAGGEEGFDRLKGQG